MAELAPKFKEETGATVKVDILDYGSLLTKTTADFVAHTAGYDVITMDIVWAGQFAANGYTVELSDLIKRDAKEIDVDDIYPILMNALGNYGGKQVAFPFAGYANVLAYRKDLYDAAGLKPPETMEELVADAYKLTDPAKKIYGFVANGQKGPAVAQDWMQYNAEMGGSILTSAGKPALNSEANIKSLTVYRDLFQKAAPPGAADYDWGGREESFRQGLAANMQTWSVGAPGYYDPKISKIVGKVGIKVAPRGAGLPKIYGIGGWGLAINADASAKQKEAAWTYIKWIASKKVHKELNLMGAGSFLRKSEMTDADLAAKFPFLPVSRNRSSTATATIARASRNIRRSRIFWARRSIRCWSATRTRRRRSTPRRPWRRSCSEGVRRTKRANFRTSLRAEGNASCFPWRSNNEIPVFG